MFCPGEALGAWAAMDGRILSWGDGGFPGVPEACTWSLDWHVPPGFYLDCGPPQGRASSEEDTSRAGSQRTGGPPKRSGGAVWLFVTWPPEAVASFLLPESVLSKVTEHTLEKRGEKCHLLVSERQPDE